MAMTKPPKEDEDLVNKMNAPPEHPILEVKDNGTKKLKDARDKTKQPLSQEIKKAIAMEITKRLEKADKKNGELSKQLEQSRNESKTELNKLSQEISSLAKLLKPPVQEEEEYLNSCEKQNEMEFRPGYSSVLDDVGDDEESLHDDDLEHDIEQLEGSLMDGLQSYKISKYVSNT